MFRLHLEVNGVWINAGKFDSRREAWNTGLRNVFDGRYENYYVEAA